MCITMSGDYGMTQHTLVWTLPIACSLAGLFFFLQQQAVTPSNNVASVIETVS